MYVKVALALGAMASTACQSFAPAYLCIAFTPCKCGGNDCVLLGGLKGAADGATLGAGTTTGGGIGGGMQTEAGSGGNGGADVAGEVADVSI